MNKPTYTIKPLYLGEMTRYEKSMHTFTFDYGVKMHSPYLAFLVQGDGKNILVDTGPKNLEVIKRYHSHVEADVPPEVHLLKVLEKHGLKPEDIDFIICIGTTARTMTASPAKKSIPRSGKSCMPSILWNYTGIPTSLRSAD